MLFTFFLWIFTLISFTFMFVSAMKSYLIFFISIDPDFTINSIYILKGESFLSKR